MRLWKLCQIKSRIETFFEKNESTFNENKMNLSDWHCFDRLGYFTYLVNIHSCIHCICVAHKKGQWFVWGNTFDGFLIQLNKTCQVMVLTRKFVVKYGDSVFFYNIHIGHGKMCYYSRMLFRMKLLVSSCFLLALFENLYLPS